MNQSQAILSNLRAFFNSGKTKDVNYRKESLKALLNAIKAHEKDIIDALKADFNKPEFETYSTEIGIIYSEINNTLKHLNKWAKPKHVKAGLSSFPSSGLIHKEPYGVVLIMAPWNYPFQLAIAPLIGAIAAGNCAIVKPSNRSPHTADIVKVILEEAFDSNHVRVVLGGHEIIGELLEEKFDFIFFTGGKKVGQLVLEKASKHLTPCILELGGKSPVFIGKDCDLEVSVRRLIWGKFINAGQTCIAPDYILVEKDIHDEFVKQCIKQIQEFYFTNNELDDTFPHLINKGHYQKVTGLIDEEKLIYGGQKDEKCNLLYPTILDNVSLDNKIMSEEIFGPVLPIITINDFKEGLDIAHKVNNGYKPLACYIFTKDKQKAQYVIENLSFGGGCINDVIMHVACDKLPFGGVGESGMGSYHGKKSFDAFTHEKSIIIKKKMDIKIRYPKYSEKKLGFVKKIM